MVGQLVPTAPRHHVHIALDPGNGGQELGLVQGIVGGERVCATTGVFRCCKWYKSAVNIVSVVAGMVLVGGTLCSACQVYMRACTPTRAAPLTTTHNRAPNTHAWAHTLRLVCVIK